MSDKKTTGAGGEPHQQAGCPAHALTTDQGVRIADNQNSLTAGERGPTLLEDFILREKITHFDHERIPERVVHARGYGAHGYFQSYGDHSDLTAAQFLNDPALKTPVFVRFSTVAGNKGSPDLARDVRGFAVKFYTQQGNFDLVGNNIPVFFIQDAIKFPDLIHSVKPERDRGFPQAQSAHDTFWDFVSLTPESVHMLLWVMSDRAIPRSLRMMQGFGVHTFCLITAEGKSTYVKFHWRPKHGSQSVTWDEAVKINGADPDFHRRDMWDAIERGDYPEFELSVQTITQEEADALDFDILDASKLIPEEDFPLKPLGKMVLDRNVAEFFAETEQVAFCPSHLVPGIGFTNDPLLQGRLFSYLDTQLKRLGGPNFHQLPINAAKCPVRNFHRGGHMQTHVPKRGRASYEPASIPGSELREHDSGFRAYAEQLRGEKRRLRPESFADHYSQARQFWRSMTPPEQRHIVSAFGFELGNVELAHIRRRTLGHLKLVDAELCARVEAALGMEGEADAIEPAVPVRDLALSPALSLLSGAAPTLLGRKIGVLVSKETDASVLAALREAAEDAGAVLAVVAPKIGGVEGLDAAPDHALAAGPSVLFDTVVVAAGASLTDEPDAKAWVMDAWRHCKVIGHTEAAAPLLEAAGVPVDADGVIPVDEDTSPYIDAAIEGRVWVREADTSG